MTLILPLVAFFGLAATPTECWTSFRGDGTSIADGRTLPALWSDENGVAWRAKIDGYGQSSPVIWRDLVVITSIAGPEKTELITTGFDLATGKQRWQHQAKGTQGVPDSDMTSKAAPTPAIDAEHVYAFFESGNLLTLDHQGQPLWSRDLVTDYGEFKCNHGLGSSPVLTQNAVIVLIENEGPSYLLALDKTTGTTLWKTDHASRVSWSSPAVTASGDEIIVSSNGVVESIDVTDGRVRWQLEGLKGNTVPSPTLVDHRVLVGSSDLGFNMLVDRSSEAKSTELSSDRVVWRSREAAASFGSPLVYRDHVYFVNKAGVAACLALADGAVLWTHRLPETYWASPLASDGRVYFFGKSGTTTVLDAGTDYQEIAENHLTVDGRVYGVAAVEARLLIRTGRELICISNP